MINKHLLITIGFSLLYTLIILIFSLNGTNYHFTYVLDDPYIHMSTAKHFAELGIWSVDGHTLASATSSPLWVMILSIFYLLLGSNLFVYAPFALNILFQILSLILVFAMVQKYTGKVLHYIFGTVLVLFTPFIALSFGGMEHSLQIFLILLFIQYFVAYISDPNSKKIQLNLILLAPFVVFVRYEDMALIFIAAMIILPKNRKLSFFLVLSGISLITVFGLWSKYYLHLGFIPSSIMAKSLIGDNIDILHQSLLIIKGCIKRLFNPHILVLLLLNIYILIKSLKSDNKIIFALEILFIFTLILHLSFANIGWYYRYEAYLIIFGLLNIYLYFHMTNKINIKVAFAVLVFCSPFFIKQLINAPYLAIIGSKNIYEQQIQMADFLKQKCNNCGIAANDIGAITYFTNIHLLDLYGLGSYDVIKYKKNGTYTNNTINGLLDSDNISLIMVYDSWFKDIKFNNYTKIADWKINHNNICGSDTVSFYSKNDQITKNLIKIRQYSKEYLPNDVIYKFYRFH